MTDEEPGVEATIARSVSVQQILGGLLVVVSLVFAVLAFPPTGTYQAQKAVISGALLISGVLTLCSAAGREDEHRRRTSV